jgi:hypothetical protein
MPRNWRLFAMYASGEQIRGGHECTDNAALHDRLQLVGVSAIDTRGGGGCLSEWIGLAVRHIVGGSGVAEGGESIGGFRCS